MQYLKISNFYNSISYKGFNELDFELYLVILQKLQDKDADEANYEFGYLKEKIGIKKNYSNEEFKDRLDECFNKILSLRINYSQDGYDFQINIFDSVKFDLGRKSVTVRRSRYSEFFLGDLAKRYTFIDIEEFLKIKGEYPKRLYMLLMQYRSTGLYRVKIEELRSLLDVPDGYANRDFTKKILVKAVEELKPVLVGLNMVVKYDKYLKGNPVKSYEFRFLRKLG